MRSVRAKTKPPARRPASVPTSDRSQRSGVGPRGPENEAAEPSRLSAFYLGHPVVNLAHRAGTGSAGNGDSCGSRYGGNGDGPGMAESGVQFMPDTGSLDTSDASARQQRPFEEREESTESAERADIQLSNEDEKEAEIAVEPPRVQQEEEPDVPQEDTVQSQTVQFWDCTEYEKPTCVQTQQASSGEQIQSKCTTCLVDKQVQGGGLQVRSPRRIQREARTGLKGASAPLPHGERIQAAFGHHDLTQVRASIGGSTRTANRRMGALAYTSGDRIGFRDAPSLHLAAHEAAHVVQQREGLRLPDNVGQPGDRWEHHADRVADSVIEGKSAEGLLDEVAAPGMLETSLPGADANASAASPSDVVQQQITSYAARMFEPPPVTPEVASQPQEAAGETEGPRTESPEPEDGGGEAEVLAAAQEGEEEAPPEGTPAQGAGSAGAGAPAEEGPPAPATSESASAPGPVTPAERSSGTDTGGPAPEAGSAAEPAAGGGINAPCYNVDPPPPPENTPEPASDNQGAESESQPQVTFEPWPDEADQCPVADTVAEGNQQISEGLGSEEGPAAGGAPVPGSPTATAPGSESAGGGTESGSREVQTMSRAAATAVDQGTGATNAMDGPIASAEAERDAAVNRYLASGAGLRAVVSRSFTLESGVTFPAATSPRQFQARQAAMATTRDFMTRAAGQIAAAAAFAQAEVPVMLGAATESAKADIQVAIENEKAAISDRIAQARAQARNGAAAARAYINSEYAISAARIEAVTLAAIDALDTAHTTSLDQMDEKETGGLDDVNSRFATGRTQHEAKGPQYADRAIERGQEHADAYEHCKGDYSDDGDWDGCLTVRRAKAQQDAACKTAAGYKDIFLRTANKKGYDLIALRRQYRCAVIAGARQVNQTLDDTHERLVSGLETGRTQAMDGIALARDQNLAAVDAALEATLQSLSTQEYTQRQAVNDTGYLKQLAIEQLAHAGAASLANGISAAMDSLEQTLTTLSERFANGGVPEPALLARSLAVTEAALGGGMGSLLDKMAEGAQQAEARIGDLGASGMEAVLLVTTQNDELSTQVESGFAQQMAGLKAGAASAIGQLTQNHVQQAEQAMTQGTASMREAVAGFDNALATIGERVDGAIATSLQELERQLTDKLGELDGQITREAWKAAEKEQPAWKSVVAIILIIVVIIAAAVISIVTLGAGASLFAVILVGALVGAVSGGLIQLINNWASGEAWHTGLAQAMIMGAIGGAIGGGLGFAGGALATGAAAAGAGRVAQLAITLGADLVSEGLTQSFGYVAFGQEFNWQGFVMAGAMSAVSFRAQPRGARPGIPAPEVPTAGAAGAAGGRRAAVAQIAGGAALGMGIEYATAEISGQEFDLTKAASAAASGAVGARMARRGGAAGPAPEPTTRLGRAAERFRSFDPGRIGAGLETRLQGLGGRIAGGPPEGGAPAGARPSAAEELPTIRPPEETPTLRPTAEETAETRTRAGETASRPIEEPGPAPGRKPIDADTAAELAGPANRMNAQDLIDATNRRMRIGDAEHDFRISREGPEVCTTCSPTIQRLTQMIDALPTGPLRSRLERLRSAAGDVQTRLTKGESGVNMVRDSTRIAAEFRALSQIHPSIGRSLQEPQLRQTTIEGTEGAVVTSPHLHNLDADIVHAQTIKASDFRNVNMQDGDQAVYILRDRSSGAVLKVGIAENNLNRATQYSNAGNKLNLDLELDVAIVRTRGRSNIRDVEANLRSRLSDEGHVLPWDNTGQRLGRSDRGTPFVHPVSDKLMWDANGNLVQKGTGTPPPPTQRGKSTPEEVAELIHQGLTDRQIASIKGVPEPSVRRWRSTWRDKITESLNRLRAADDIDAD